jgi:hypothetical protein
MPSPDREKKPRRRYSTTRLAREPLTIPTCSGTLIITAEQDRDKGVFRVVVSLPDNLEQVREPAADAN